METLHDLDQSTIDGLQDLIAINIDSVKGFNEAAEKIENAGVASAFRDIGRDRADFATELQGAVARSGDEPKDSGSIKGTLHRWWLSLRGTIQDGDEKAILDEAVRGEDEIVSRYQDVLPKIVGSPLNAVLHRQYTTIKAGRDTLAELRDARK